MRFRLFYRLINGKHIVSVYRNPGYAVGLRSNRKIIYVHAFTGAERHAVLIVLADINDRQAPDGRHVDRFVKRSFVQRSVAKETDDNPAFVSKLERYTGSGRDGDPAADDTVGTEIAAGEIGYVHAATFAATVTGFLPEQLCHHFLQIYAFPDCMPVTTVSAGHEVLVVEVCERADRGRLFTAVQVSRSVHHTPGKEIGYLIFKRSDMVHFHVHIEQFLFGKRPGSLQCLRFLLFGHFCHGMLLVFFCACMTVTNVLSLRTFEHLL